MKTMILVTGQTLSGKSEVANMIERKGIPMFRLGDLIREEVQRRGLPITVENQEAIARQARQELGQDIFARRMLEKVDRLPDPLVCVEGARDMSEIRFLQLRVRLVLVVVELPDAIRWQRLRARLNERDPVGSIEQYKERMARELERGLREVLAYRGVPRFVIDNSGTQEALARQAERALKEIRTLAARPK